jgi:hypothetical protein
MGNSSSSTLSDALITEKLKQEQLNTQAKKLKLEALEEHAKQEQLNTQAKKLQLEEHAKQEQLKLEALEEHAKQERMKTYAATNAVAREQADRDAREAHKTQLAIAVGLGLVGLAADYWYNGSTQAIRWRMRKALTSGSFMKNLKLPPAIPFNTYQAKLVPTFLPTMLIGPTGCGKSTLLSMIARELLAAKQPVLYLSIRGDVSQDPRTTKDDQPTAVPSEEEKRSNAILRMNSVTTKLLDEMGYPRRDPLILPFLKIFRRIRYGEAEVELAPNQKTVSRFKDAFACFFEVCREIRDERLSQGHSLPSSAPSLLLDEVHDLIRDERLAMVGGKEMFNTLAIYLVTEGVNKETVRTVMAGSNGKLVLDANETTLGSRAPGRYRLKDPKESDVIAALKTKGYTDEACKKLVGFLGTRLRLYDSIFKTETPGSVDAIIEACTTNAETSYANFFKKFPDPHIRRAVVTFVDLIYETGAVNIDKAPWQLKQIDFSKVLFMEHDGDLLFQSEIMRNLWPQIKAEYCNNNHHNNLPDVKYMQ